MAQQQLLKPPDLDSNGRPIIDEPRPPDIPADITPPDISVESEQPKEGMISRIYRALTNPTTTAVSDTLNPKIDEFFGTGQIHPNAKFGREGLKFLTGAADQLTSPVDMGITLLSGGSSLAAKSGLSGLSRGLSLGAKAAAVPAVTHGAINTLHPDSTMMERGIGLMEAAGGGATLRPTSRIGQVADDMVNPNTPHAIPQSLELSPVNTGPKIGQSVRMKEPTIENIAKARREGWEIDPKNPLTTDGKVNMVFTGKKFDEVLEADVAGASVSKDALEMSGKKDRTLLDAVNLPRTIMASTDMSAPLRQGLGLIHKKEFWKAIGPMFKSWKDEDYFNELQKTISEKPLFKARQEQVLMNGKPVIDSKTGKPKIKTTTSFAEDAGIKLTDIGEDLTKREESMMSRFADSYPGVTRSNRAYVAFLNKLRADSFESLMKANNVINPYDKNNAVLAKEMANFINNATGRGSLDFGKLGSLEKSANVLSTVLFSPRLISSRVQMLNPANYLMGNPAVRKEYLKSMLAIGVAGNSVLALGSQIPGTSVEMDPRSKDFAKLRFENGVRIDPWAGFQQYLTQTTRQIPNLKNIGQQTDLSDLMGSDLPDVGGVAKSSESGNVYEMGKFGTNTRRDEAITFAEQKMNPVLTLITRAMAGKDFAGDPFNLPEEVVARFVPIFLADLKQLVTENPNLLPFPENYLDNFTPENLPFALPAAFGMGMQQYGKK